MVTLNLDKIFDPQNVAIIGASDVEGSVGYALVKNFSSQLHNKAKKTVIVQNETRLCSLR
jgi:acyl-CoA synthetase (NDP forming)